jgi:predicted ester cyclase
MTIENKQTHHAPFHGVINTSNEKLATKLISPNAVFHVPRRPEPLQGPAECLEVLGMMRSGLPDIQWTLEEMIAEGDNVAARFTMRGTHKGIFFGIPPTGKKIAVSAMNFVLSVERRGLLGPGLIRTCSCYSRIFNTGTSTGQRYRNSTGIFPTPDLTHVPTRAHIG